MIVACFKLIKEKDKKSAKSYKFLKIFSINKKIIKFEEYLIFYGNEIIKKIE